MKRQLKLGVVINNLEGRYQSSIFKGIQSFAAANNVSLSIFNGRSINSPYPSDLLFNKVFDLVNHIDLDGLIIFTGAIGTNSSNDKLYNWLVKLTNKPVVTVGRTVKGYCGVVPENKKGIKQAIKHLVDKHGREKFAFISGPKDNPESLERLSAYKEGLKLVGIEYNSDNVYYGDYSYRLAKKISLDIVKDNYLPFDAIICASDEMAWSLQDSLEEKGYLVPNDYSLIGFDDLAESAFQKPPLTTVHQDLFGQAFKAGDMLLDIISNSSNPDIFEIDSKIIVRESCGCNFLDNLNIYKNNELSENSREIIGIFVNKKIDQSTEVKDELQHILNSLVDNLNLNIKTKKHTSIFLLSLSEWLEVTLNWEHYSEIWFESLHLLQNIFTNNCQSDALLIFLDDLFSKGFLLLSQMSDKKEALILQKKNDLDILFRDLSKEMNSNLTFNNLISTLREFIPLLGISNLALILTDMDEYRFFPIREYNKLTDLKMSKDIRLNNYTDDINQIILPLVCQSTFFGYLLMSDDYNDPQIYALLQEEISKALLVLDFFKSKEQLLKEKEELIGKYKLSEHRYKEMIDMVPMLMWETDERYKITYINNIARDKLGLDEGDSILTVIDNDDRRRVESDKFSDFRGLKIKKIAGEGHILIVQVNDINLSDNNKLHHRWHALDPLPFVLENTLPTDDFFKDYNITTRESEIVLLLFHGLKIREIAESVSLAESTIKGHITKIYNKLGVDDREGLMNIISNYKVKKEGYGNYLFKIFNQLINNQFL